MVNWLDVQQDWIGYEVRDTDIPAHDWWDHEDRTTYMFCHVPLGTVVFVAPDRYGNEDIAVVFTDTGIIGVVNVKTYRFLTMYVSSQSKLLDAYTRARGKGNELPLPQKTLLAVRELYKNPEARVRLEMT